MSFVAEVRRPGYQAGSTWWLASVAWRPLLRLLVRRRLTRLPKRHMFGHFGACGGFPDDACVSFRQFAQPKVLLPLIYRHPARLAVMGESLLRHHYGALSFRMVDDRHDYGILTAATVMLVTVEYCTAVVPVPYTLSGRGIRVRPSVAPVPPGQVTVLPVRPPPIEVRSEEHTSELQSRGHLVCRLLLD